MKLPALAELYKHTEHSFHLQSIQMASRPSSQSAGSFVSTCFILFYLRTHHSTSSSQVWHPATYISPPATMAPLPTSSAWNYLPSLSKNSLFARRALSTINEPTATFTPHQQYVAQVLALTTASISILASLITSYWFLKMRRSFRHQ